MSRTNWRDHANCVGIGAAPFYPEPGQPVDSQAVRACHACPVATECLTHALVNEPAGWWANTSPEDRKQIRKERGIVAAWTPPTVARCGTPAGYKRHRRLHETVCPECREARNASKRVAA